MPTKEELRDEVMRSSPDEWEYFDPEPTWVLELNRDLSIRLLRQYSREERQIEQPDWASAMPNPTTAEDILRVEYRGAPFDQFKVIELDEYRVTMVYPDREVDSSTGQQNLYLTDYEAHLSRIMSLDDFDSKFDLLDVDIR